MAIGVSLGLALLAVHATALSTLQPELSEAAQNVQHRSPLEVYANLPAIARVQPGVRMSEFDMGAFSTDNVNNDSSLPCSNSEKQVLVPVESLTNKIVGKYSSYETVLPHKPPGGCEGAASFNGITDCYYKWGFSLPVATCWAKEKTKEFSECGDHCIPYEIRGKYNVLCQNCMAKKRIERQTCTFTAMELSEGCLTCTMKAYTFWNQECMMQCVDALKDQEPQASPGCKVCNDEKDKMLLECGAK